MPLFRRRAQCWDYQAGMPVVSLCLVTESAEEAIHFQVDTGFSGWILLDWDRYQRLGLARNELPEEFWPQVRGFGGSRRLQAAYVQVRLPDLDFEQPQVAYSGPGLGSEWNLVGLRFLESFRWSGDGKHFCLQRRR